ncbi:MAG TPA: hypothetical protein DCF45_02020 [Gammaproteobacteria bacterium]|nr:hypothetical protein [Gammaproteobacteria bacterium]
MQNLEAETLNGQIEQLHISNLRGPLAPGVSIYSAGQPSADQLAGLARLGIGLVVNLRPAAEMKDFDEEGVVTALGMDYQHIPISGAADLTTENAAQLQRALATSSRPVVVHCAGGNRVGALIAVKAKWIDGLRTQEAIELGVTAGLQGLLTAVEQLLRDA